MAGRMPGLTEGLRKAEPVLVMVSCSAFMLDTSSAEVCVNVYWEAGAAQEVGCEIGGAGAWHDRRPH